MMDDDGWVEVRRFDDVLQADMMTGFLRDHGVTVRTRGNAGATGILNRLNTIVDIRVDVPRAEIELAQEALRAFEVGEMAEEPFRGASPKSEAPASAYVPPRKRTAAMMLGVLVPIGAGHFYARHGAAGAILCAGVIGSALGMIVGTRHVAHAFGVAWGLIVIADIAGASAAVRRFNEGRVPSEAVHRGAALAVVGAAFAAAFAFAGR